MIATTIINSMSVKGGVVTAMLAEQFAEGGIITLTPEVRDGKLIWTCRANLQDRYLPAECRNRTGP